MKSAIEERIRVRNQTKNQIEDEPSLPYKTIPHLMTANCPSFLSLIIQPTDPKLLNRADMVPFFTPSGSGEYGDVISSRGTSYSSRMPNDASGDSIKMHLKFDFEGKNRKVKQNRK